MRSILVLEHDDDHRYVTRGIFDDNHDAAKIHFAADSNNPFAVLISHKKNFLSLPSLILLNHDAARESDKIYRTYEWK